MKPNQYYDRTLKDNAEISTVIDFAVFSLKELWLVSNVKIMTLLLLSLRSTKKEQVHNSLLV